ncbi:hypothetical protein ABLN64_15935 [Mycobacterium tuberculosis]
MLLGCQLPDSHAHTVKELRLSRCRRGCRPAPIATLPAGDRAGAAAARGATEPALRRRRVAADRDGDAVMLAIER